MKFLINLINILNLWHGANILTIISLVTKLFMRLLCLINLSCISSNIKVLIKIISLSLAILFAEKILTNTRKYFQFETIIKIKLVDYDNDANYPYMSFIFSDKMPYFPINLFERKKYFNYFNGILQISKYYL